MPDDDKKRRPPRHRRSTAAVFALLLMAAAAARLLVELTVPPTWRRLIPSVSPTRLSSFLPPELAEPQAPVEPPRKPVCPAAEDNAWKVARCLPDQLAGAVPPPAHAAGDDENYLVYAPQFGLSNQLVALRNAVMWAVILKRTLVRECRRDPRAARRVPTTTGLGRDERLAPPADRPRFPPRPAQVVPHLLGYEADASHGASGLGIVRSAPHGAAFDVPAAARALAPLRVVEMDAFLAKRLVPAQLLALPANVKYSNASDGYYTLFGDKWSSCGPAAALSAPLPNFTAPTILSAFGACAHHQVLAFRSLFAAFDGRAAADFPPPGRRWLDRQVMPALLRPTALLSSMVDTIVAGVQTSAASDGSRPEDARRLGFGCAHVRQGDFVDECAKYAAEERGGNPRSWVRWHARHGWSCLQSLPELALNLDDMRARSPGLPLYVAIEDETLLSSPSLRGFGARTLHSFATAYNAAALPLPATIGSVLLDQLVCGRADHLLLNIYSTFSQLVIGRVGMREGGPGWTRDLSADWRNRMGVSLSYWRRTEPLDETRLVPMPRF